MKTHETAVIGCKGEDHSPSHIVRTSCDEQAFAAVASVSDQWLQPCGSPRTVPPSTPCRTRLQPTGHRSVDPATAESHFGPNLMITAGPRQVSTSTRVYSERLDVGVATRTRPGLMLDPDGSASRMTY